MIARSSSGSAGVAPSEVSHSRVLGHGGAVRPAVRLRRRPGSWSGDNRSPLLRPAASASWVSEGVAPIHTTSSKPRRSRTSVQPSSPSLPGSIRIAAPQTGGPPK